VPGEEGPAQITIGHGRLKQTLCFGRAGDPPGSVVQHIGNIEREEGVVPGGIDHGLGPFQAVRRAFDHDVVGIGAVAGRAAGGEGREHSRQPEPFEGAAGMALFEAAETEEVIGPWRGAGAEIL